MPEGERFGAQSEQRPVTIRRASRKVTASMTERPDEGAGPGEKGGPSSPPAKEPTNGERDERMKRAVEAARRQAEERATAEILALEEDFERERERAAKTLEEVQRLLEVAEARAAGNVSVTDARSRTRESQQLDAEMRRLQAESDAKIEEALAKVESETRARLQREADRRLTEQEEQLRAEANERVQAAGETARREAERQFQDELRTLRGQLEEERGSREQLIEKAEARAKRAEANVNDVETARLDAEAEARSAAAEWLRGQTRALQQETEKPAKPEVGKPKPEDDTTEQKADGSAEPKVGFLRRRAEARRARRAEKAAEREKQGSTAKAASQVKSSSESKGADSQPATEKARPRRRGGPLDVNKASFEQFRELGMSVTQATRVIAYRERQNGFQSVDDLDAVPGLSKKLIKIRDQLTA